MGTLDLSIYARSSVNRGDVLGFLTTAGAPSLPAVDSPLVDAPEAAMSFTKADLLDSFSAFKNELRSEFKQDIDKSLFDFRADLSA